MDDDETASATSDREGTTGDRASPANLVIAATVFAVSVVIGVGLVGLFTGTLRPERPSVVPIDLPAATTTTTPTTTTPTTTTPTTTTPTTTMAPATTTDGG